MKASQSLVALVTLSTGLALPHVAGAQDVPADADTSVPPVGRITGDDTIVLRSGEELHGRIAMQRPHGPAVIVFADETTRRVAPDEIRAIRRAPVIPIEPEEQSSGNGEPMSTEPLPGYAPVTFTSPSPWLQVGYEGETTSREVTPFSTVTVEVHHTLGVTPCTIYVQPHTTARFWSGGLQPDGQSMFMSGPFALDVPASGLNVGLRAGSPGLRGLGVLTAGLGAAGNAAGILFIALTVGRSDGLAIAGYTTFGVSALIFAGGLALAVYERGGVDSVRARRATQALRFGVAPLAEGGAFAGLAGAF